MSTPPVNTPQTFVAPPEQSVAQVPPASSLAPPQQSTAQAAQASSPQATTQAPPATSIMPPQQSTAQAPQASSPQTMTPASATTSTMPPQQSTAQVPQASSQQATTQAPPVMSTMPPTPHPKPAGTWHKQLYTPCCGGTFRTLMGACFCAPCFFGRIDSRIRNFPETNDIRTYNSPCMFFSILGCIGRGTLTVMAMMDARRRVREMFNIPGNPFKDCAVACFCGPCALMQMDTELKERAAEAQGLREKAEGGYEGHSAGMSYQPQQTTAQAHAQRNGMLGPLA